MLGKHVLQQLRPFGFPLAGWSRSGVTLEGVEVFAGESQLPEFLARTDILICLLPLTDETRGILNSRLFRQLPRGAALINVGRGAHLINADLLEALDAEQCAPPCSMSVTRNLCLRIIRSGVIQGSSSHPTWPA
jgi:glyoxylate/hydroxypyruvate reductase A